MNGQSKIWNHRRHFHPERSLAIKSDAWGPTISTPRTTSVSWSAMTRTNPSAFPVVSARLLAANGNFPVEVVYPHSRPPPRRDPQLRFSGSVKMTAGMAATSIALGRPAMTSAATSPSFEALCANMGPETISPIAKIPSLQSPSFLKQECVPMHRVESPQFPVRGALYSVSDPL